MKAMKKIGHIAPSALPCPPAPNQRHGLPPFEALVTDDVRATRTRGRGRPKRSADLHLSDNILLAASRLMIERKSSELLLREVAEEAATSISMIYYYFGSLNGLLFCLVDKHMRRIIKSLHDLGRQLENSVDRHSHLFIVGLENVYRTNEVAIRLVIAEGLKCESSLRESYFAKYRLAATKIIEGIFRDLQRRHIYDESVDVRMAATMILCVVGTPTIHGKILPEELVLQDSPEHARWLQHATQVLDRLFLATD